MRFVFPFFYSPSSKYCSESLYLSKYKLWLSYLYRNSFSPYLSLNWVRNSMWTLIYSEIWKNPSTEGEFENCFIKIWFAVANTMKIWFAVANTMEMRFMSANTVEWTRLIIALLLKIILLCDLMEIYSEYEKNLLWMLRICKKLLWILWIWKKCSKCF